MPATTLLLRAGLVTEEEPKTGKGRGWKKGSLEISGLTQEEFDELVKYLAFLRSRRRGS